MSTGIQWTDETWNPAVGCTHISPGCDHCYAATVASRQMQPAHVGLTVGRKWNDTVRLLPDRLDEPLRWRKPRRVFVGSMTDLFHQDVPLDFILSVWTAMSRSPQHTFQVLTKRPQRMARIVDSIAWWWDGDDKGGEAYAWPGPCSAEDHDTGEEFNWAPTEGDLDGGGEEPLLNVWLGTSIESQTYAWRARHLAATPAAVRFLSVEPLLGAVDLTGHLDGIHWVIVGAESGPGRRGCRDSWARDIRDQCAAVGVPLFVKQLQDRDGRVLHDVSSFPADLRIREWPT
jgi:protein gp37